MMNTAYRRERIHVCKKRNDYRDVLNPHVRIQIHIPQYVPSLSI